MVAALAASLALAGPAAAEIAGVPNGAGGEIACTVQSGANAGERWCGTDEAIFTTFDGAPIDISVAFPPAPATGVDGLYPIVGYFHGWGGSKYTPDKDELQQWLDAGYAVFSMSDRGWGRSCGGQDPKRLAPGLTCAEGYNHLMDTRFEVRDAQEVFEALADRNASNGAAGQGLIDPQRIASMGSSYGGGISMALGALRNRKMMPDGTLIPWVSDQGHAMRIAAAAPDIPWTDLAASLQPNGSTLDYVVDSPYLGVANDRRIGVEKLSFVSGLFATGAATSNYAPPGTDQDADLITWYGLINAGEPYDENPLAADIVNELTTHHSSYYIDDSVAPAPMLISNGWTDDLFPADEAIRFYNRTRSHHPDTPISLMFTDHGHQRGQNKAIDAEFRRRQVHAWFDHYVRGDGPAPFDGVQTLTQTCPKAAPSGGSTGPFDDLAADEPFRAATWATIAPGEVRLESAATKTIAPSVGPDAASVSQAFDPIAGGGACASASSADLTGAATYRLEPAPAGGYTLMGSPTVIADIAASTPTSQVAARLVDVDPETRTETLVARALLRPSDNGLTVFQLHPNGWKFKRDHVAKLELLPNDAPYSRTSNGQGPVTVADLELRLPVLEAPGEGPAVTPAPKVLPDDYVLTPDYPPADDKPPPGATTCGDATLSGGRKNDKLRGTSGDDSIPGKRGADRISGLAGDDCLNGNQGRDRVNGGAGADQLRGGAGNDVVRGGSGTDAINCGQGRHDVAVAKRGEPVRGCERVRRR